MKALADYREADLRVPKGAPFYFRYGRLAAETDIELHTHPWGQLSRISLGLLEMTVESRRLTAPAEYLIWVPANLPHASSIRQATDYISVYVAKPLAIRLPATSCLIPQTPLVRALFEDFAARRVTTVADDWDMRQFELMIELLARAGHADSYLPDSSDRQLEPILHAIRLDPADATTLQAWAERVHSTERTLARRFQSELGMSFVQWRNRVRLLRALVWLKEDRPVHDIALALGYGTASAFIAMFRKQIGFSPQRYRRQMRSETAERREPV
ncbi:AraC family transcriptional regulator [Ralstonia pseudosolanacearum]|uniref:AraC family transcriptional regulator n=2 Tax=Ralstonia solanacearum species complex TaxID=3116862 RepID=A0A0S4U260_RALSL|nr:helix-turn-helix transcriptional regulator [Ralstonia pseudosolanacearum]AUS44319.1 AraC family transcriptional regulator [Ralstonia solanacearum]AVV67672.1 AraC family transcriptional regulator [Ralstonia solanacearum OE1-1]API76648.1 AraC family transcriptional regulator [Ralstonia pseudosolanacearum]AST88955.1 AraC family transcriptional regulator [Ralstonia pseudosolanacearum]AYA48328.1 AraC family transcriptional regulator [Ralstonia pseudosolanacearum]